MNQAWARKITKKLAQLDALDLVVKAEKAALSKTKTRIKALTEAQILTQKIAQSVQTKAHSRISRLVTKCLAIFDEPYTFKILVERKRGKTESRLVFERNGLAVDPLTASGGGVVDVAVFALRVACILLEPERRRLLVLDEPFKFVSRDMRERVQALVARVARETRIQIVLVTHDPELQCGTVVDLTV